MAINVFQSCSDTRARKKTLMFNATLYKIVRDKVIQVIATKVLRYVKGSNNTNLHLILNY